MTCARCGKIWYNIIYDRYYLRTHVYVFLFSVKKRVFELSRVWPWRWPRGVPHTWYLWAQSLITLLKLVWREYAIVAMHEWKKKCVGLQRTWASKRTVRREEGINSTHWDILAFAKRTMLYVSFKKGYKGFYPVGDYQPINNWVTCFTISCTPVARHTFLISDKITIKYD